MSFFDAFVGGAADTYAGIIGDQIKSQRDLEKQTALAKIQEELFAQRQQTIQKMLDERNAGAGAEIEKRSQQLRLDRIQNLAKSQNPELSGGLSPEELQQAADNPEVLKQLGIIDRSRAQEQDDKGSIAESMGRLDFAKDYRANAQQELARTAEDRKVSALEQANAIAGRKAELQQTEIDRKAERDESWKEIMLAKIGAKDGSATDHTNAEMIKSIDSDRKEIAQKVKETNDALGNTNDKAVKADLTLKLKGYMDEYSALNTRKQVLYKRLGFDDSGSAPAKSGGKALTFDPATGTFK